MIKHRQHELDKQISIAQSNMLAADQDDSMRLVSQLVALQVAASGLIAEIDKLDGICEMPYRNAKALAMTAGVVRVLLGEQPKLKKKEKQPICP